jgi:hypothetical protein
LTRSVGIPWQHISGELDISIDKEGKYLSYRVGGVWGQPFSVIAEGTPEHPISTAPFGDANEAVNYLVRPLMGFFAQRGKAWGFKIWHPEVKPYGGLINQVQFPLLKSLKLLDESDISKPDSILLVPNAYFFIYMPPEMAK